MKFIAQNVRDDGNGFDIEQVGLGRVAHVDYFGNEAEGTRALLVRSGDMLEALRHAHTWLESHCPTNIDGAHIAGRDCLSAQIAEIVESLEGLIPWEEES